MTFDGRATDHVMKFPRPSPSVFAYGKRSKTGGIEDPGTRLQCPMPTNAQHPMSTNAQRPMPNAQCPPTPSAQCPPMPNAPMNAQRPMPMPNAPCSMLHAQCSMLNAQCSMLNAQCSMLNAQCLVELHVLIYPGHDAGTCGFCDVCCGYSLTVAEL